LIFLYTQYFNITYKNSQLYLYKILFYYILGISFQILHQQSIVMTPTQNQIQDELQRKHEELQQLIVHQQEELRRVSEQLFIARYGILTPLLNVCIF